MGFLEACANGDLERVGLLIGDGIYVDGGLCTAALNGHLRVVELLVRNGVDVNERCDGSSALMLAIYRIHYDVVDFLLDNGADIGVMDNEGWFPLAYASYYRNFPLVANLVYRGADVNVLCRAMGHTHTPLTLAAISSDLGIVEFLLENGADPDIVGDNGRGVWDYLGGKSESLFRGRS